MHKPTAAHRKLPFGTKLRLRNPRNGHKLDVCITDRGPYNEWQGIHYFKDKRDLDVSWHVARELGFERVGVEWLTYRILTEKCPASD